MALKSTSQPLQISTKVSQNVANAFEVTAVDLQLNPLDQEVFVVTGVKIDFLGTLPLVSLAAPVGGLFPTTQCGISATRPTSMPTVGVANCIAYGDRQVALSVVAGALASYAVIEQGPSETPDTNIDYIAIISTSNYFIALDSINTLNTIDCAVRVFGYRARADAATYAALVSSEVLSA